MEAFVFAMHLAKTLQAKRSINNSAHKLRSKTVKNVTNMSAHNGNLEIGHPARSPVELASRLEVHNVLIEKVVLFQMTVAIIGRGLCKSSVFNQIVPAGNWAHGRLARFHVWTGGVPGW